MGTQAEPRVRVEVDLLGQREVPEQAYYGVHTLRAIENFRISHTTINDVPQMIRGMVMVKKASALANRELGTIQTDVADAIVAACNAILDEGRCMDQWPIDVFQGGAGTSTNMCTNEVVANLALELVGLPKGDYAVINPNDHVNKSQSTNDAYPTGFRLAVHMLIDDLVTEVEVGIAQAALGTRFTLPTLDGDEDLVVPPGTQPGREFVLRQRGVPRLHGRGRGDLIARVAVVVPTKLSSEETELLTLFASSRGEHIERPESGGLFSRIKSAFS